MSRGLRDAIVAACRAAFENSLLNAKTSLSMYEDVLKCDDNMMHWLSELFRRAEIERKFFMKVLDLRMMDVVEES